MRKGLLSLFSALVVLALFVTPAAAHQQGFDGLQPGKFVTLKQTVPINLVFIGYKDLKKSDLRDQLPKAYDPAVRYPQFYGLNGRDMGLHFDFQYRLIDASSRFEDQFFSYLARAGQPGPITAYQQQYNDQTKNVLDVTGPVLYIDAPSTEQWLNKHNDDLGIAGDRGYTIYFINWYTRKDFKFHVYTKTDTVDPDTNYNFGVQRASRKMIAWGGSSSRSWFYDLSAGPEAWTNNLNVDTPDLDGNGKDDYHMPPVWEYRKHGYREPSQLSVDLGKITRFVGIDLLFTTSPLYDPLLTAPGPGGAKVVYTNLFEHDPASKGKDWIDINYARDMWRSFEPYYRWRVQLKDHKPIEADVKHAFDIWAQTVKADDCWNAIGTTGAELFCYFDANRSKFVPAFGKNDYVGAVYAFNTTDANLGVQVGLLGFADDNWVDGTQSYVFLFDTPEDRALGYGFTTTLIHEFGHHIGMSHPHDGYDSELGLDFDSVDAFEFAWSGDESNTVMHYIALSNGFGQFDRDNMYRWETAGYLNWSNALLADILASPNSGKVKRVLAEADQEASQAQDAFRSWDYQDAVRHARRAYEKVATAAASIGVSSPKLGAALRVLPNVTPPHEGDPIRFPNN